VATSDKALARYGEHTQAVVTLSEMSIGKLIRNPDASLNSDKRLDAMSETMRF
jgi:hypothetical protein